LSTVIFAAAAFAAASETIFASAAAFSAAAFAAASAMAFAAALASASAIALAASAMAFAAASAIAFSAATHAASQTGAGGGEEVVIALDAADATEVRLPLLAVTVNVYVVDADKPVIEIGEVLPDAVIPPGDDVTV
jgi:hypothetical protein